MLQSNSCSFSALATSDVSAPVATAGRSRHRNCSKHYNTTTHLMCPSHDLKLKLLWIRGWALDRLQYVFFTLWPCNPMTFDLLTSYKMGSEDSWWTIPVASLVMVVSAVLVLSCGQTPNHTHARARTHTPNHTQTQTWMIAILTRLPSAWVTSQINPSALNISTLWKYSNL